MNFEEFMNCIQNGNIDEINAAINNGNLAHAQVEKYFLQNHPSTYPTNIMTNLGGGARNIFCTPLQLACATNNVQIVQWLLHLMNRLNLNENICGLILNSGDTKDCSGRTPLHLAVANENIEMVNLLLGQQYININTPSFVNNRKLTILCFSMHMGNNNITALLIQHGADVNDFSDRVGGSEIPLTVAITNNQVNIVQLLITNGANINAKFTPSIVPNLLQRDGMYHFSDWTPLRLAIMTKNVDIITLLLQNNVQIDNTSMRLIQNNTDPRLLFLTNFVINIRNLITAPETDAMPTSPRWV